MTQQCTTSSRRSRRSRRSWHSIPDLPGMLVDMRCERRPYQLPGVLRKGWASGAEGLSIRRRKREEEEKKNLNAGPRDSACHAYAGQRKRMRMMQEKEAHILSRRSDSRDDRMHRMKRSERMRGGKGTAITGRRRRERSESVIAHMTHPLHSLRPSMSTRGKGEDHASLVHPQNWSERKRESRVSGWKACIIMILPIERQSSVPCIQQQLIPYCSRTARTGESYCRVRWISCSPGISRSRGWMEVRGGEETGARLISPTD